MGGEEEAADEEGRGEGLEGPVAPHQHAHHPGQVLDGCRERINY